jgi:hypothetical protein
VNTSTRRSDLARFRGQHLGQAEPDGAPGLKVAEFKLPRARLDRLTTLLDGLQYIYGLEVHAAHPVAEIGLKSARAST